jgi:hypothetical protein
LRAAFVRGAVFAHRQKLPRESAKIADPFWESALSVWLTRGKRKNTSKNRWLSGF